MWHDAFILFMIAMKPYMYLEPGITESYKCFCWLCQKSILFAFQSSFAKFSIFSNRLKTAVFNKSGWSLNKKNSYKIFALLLSKSLYSLLRHIRVQHFSPVNMYKECCNFISSTWKYVARIIRNPLYFRILVNMIMKNIVTPYLNYFHWEFDFGIE